MPKPRVRIQIQPSAAGQGTAEAVPLPLRLAAPTDFAVPKRDNHSWDDRDAVLYYRSTEVDKQCRVR